MTLKRYHQKRDFKKTTEPYGKKKTSKGPLLYIIQKHAASHLHYDFRLELAGVLKSWAVPKGPSLDPKVKHLAMHVEDHPIEYGSFQGIIPKGQYGGGTVMLWDEGSWIPEGENPELAYKKGNLTFTLKGKKLKGLWKLIRLKNDPKAWLLFKIADQYAKDEKEFNVTEKKPRSVTTNQTMDEIAENYNRIWDQHGEVKVKSKKARKTESTKKKIQIPQNAEKSRYPTIEAVFPELATLVGKPPKGREWLHEVKLDGYRLLTFINNKKIKLITRGKQDWTHKFPHLVAALQALDCKNAVLDGEIVAFDKKQRSDFQLLQNSIHENDDRALVYYLFDVIFYNDYSLLNVALIERKKLLQTLLKNTDNILQYNDHVIGDGDAIFKKSCQLKLEGIVAKKVTSPYVFNRSKAWLKIKCVQRQEFVIGGFTKPAGSRQHFGSLLLGVYDKNKQFRYCGHVGTGFTAISLQEIVEQLKKIISKDNPFVNRPPGVRSATWVKPKLVAEVEFSEWTSDGILRHPSFKGLRLDKKPNLITHEIPKK